MTINLKQLPDGSMGLEGKDAGNAPFIIAETEWLAATVDKCFFVAPRAMVVQAINARVDTAGSDGSAVTAVIRKVPSGTAITSGTALHTGSINLKGTAATNQSLTLTSTAVTLAAGDALAIDFTGTLTAAVGTVTVAMTPR
jgi:hypothetical protein